MATETLYSPRVLALATSLATYPWDDKLPLQGSARSKSCGSTISLGLAVDAYGRIQGIGLKSHACAIGQAAAAIFAEGAIGRDAACIHRAGNAIELWLTGQGELPDWPGIGAIGAALEYPARHGAIMLAWRAAMDLLPSG
jgi:NifU-like protein involved in Fe-S cluster formation